jgi:hypothetical protein
MSLPQNKTTKHTMSDKTQNTRSIASIAREIRLDWGAKVNFAARPYLEAMLTLHENCPSYGADSGESIVRYFLCNASSYRGEKAKALKAELKTLCGMK